MQALIHAAASTSSAACTAYVSIRQHTPASVSIRREQPASTLAAGPFAAALAAIPAVNSGAELGDRQGKHGEKDTLASNRVKKVVFDSC